MDDVDKKVQQLLRPMLDVFGGADGGVAFARLKFDLLPHIYNIQNPSEDIIQLQKSLETFSMLCKTILDNNLRL